MSTQARIMIPGEPSADVDAVLQAGLRWLYQTTQPATAIINPRSAWTAIGPRSVLRFVPSGWADRPCIIVEHLDHAAARASGALLAAPVTFGEVTDLARKLRALGAPVTETHCTGTAVVATIELAQPAEPTLHDAALRYLAGCRVHQSRRCDRPREHGGHSCSWYRVGHRDVVEPDWPTNPHLSAALLTAH